MSNVAHNRTVASCIANGSTNIPLRRTLSKPKTNGVVANGNSINNNKNMNTISCQQANPNKWMQKFEEAEQKRKALLSQNEKNLRSIQDLEKKNTQLQIKQEELETELFEKNETIAKLTLVSKNLFKEYDTLKTQYETETQAMHRALNDATHWYKENKVLRRRTLLLDKDTVDEGVDTDESNTDTDLENLRDSVRQLSQEVAQLQAELNSVKLLEYETTESNANLSEELESERKKNEGLLRELNELRESHDQMLRVSNIVRRELEELKENEKREKENAVTLRREADDYKKERNVLAHQSTLLMQGLQCENGIDSLVLLQEIEDLKRTVEEERNQHCFELRSLQEKLEEQDNNSHVEILEERLKLVESELQHALERAENAEKTEKEVSSPPPPPLPPTAPPLPPPPPPPMSLAPPAVPLRTKKIAKTGLTEISDPCDANNENCPGEAATKGKPFGVHEDIINQIKGGTFTLKKSKNGSKKKERETPKAVTEMLNVLGSLRKVSRSKMTVSANFGDVQL